MTAAKILSEEMTEEILELCKHLPVKSAACIEGLKVIQKHQRWVSDQAVKELGGLLDMSPEAIDSVATYYSLIFRRPVARHMIFVCNSVSCWIMGYEKIADHLKNKVSIDFGGSTGDDKFTVLPIPCLGTCDHAPAMIIDEDLHQDLTIEKLDNILNQYQ
jgi:NADH-quinone oxidoreductase subunit E